MASVDPSVFLLKSPFGDAHAHILRAWFELAHLFTNAKASDWNTADFVSSVNATPALISLADTTPTFTNPHLTEGILGTVRRMTKEKNANPTRPFLLMSRDFRQPQVLNTLEVTKSSTSSRRHRPRQALYSPLFFLRRMLTVPDQSASEAYAHAVVRAVIFAETANFAIGQKRLVGDVDLLDLVRELIDYQQVASSVRKAESYRKNRDTFHPADPTDFLVGHLLASRGLAVLSFAPGTEIYDSLRQNERPIVGRDTFLRSGSIVPDRKYSYEFRWINELARLPSADELINELDGIPIPIPGADAVFLRGLRTSVSKGVVGRISGTSGTGKTSLALALSATLAPLGVRCYYLSCEEDAADLLRRVGTLTPPYVTRLEAYKRKRRNPPFIPVHLDHDDPETNFETVRENIASILASYRQAGVEPSKHHPPGILPLMFVLDGVHELVQASPLSEAAKTRQMHELVEDLRKLGALVLILTAATNLPAISGLDYLADFVISLEHEHRSDATEEPKRTLVLHKTRLQAAWAGAHHFHISKRDGVKIYPQLPAQLDQHKVLKWRGQSDRLYSFLRSASTIDGTRAPKLVDISDASQILIGGHGSTGKSAFALRMVLSPRLARVGGKKEDLQVIDDDDGNLASGTLELFDSALRKKDSPARPHRILVVSFLYQGDYYVNLAHELTESANNGPLARQELITKFRLDTLTLYPGFLLPEVFVNKIANLIRAAELEGLPYQAIIIDGLHNVFLQFPRLENAKMIWPTISEMLRIFGITVVITHTHLDVSGMEDSNRLMSDVETANARISPLLQALVNSADYYFDVSFQALEDGTTVYPIKVVSALGQNVGRSSYFWNRARQLVEYRPDLTSKMRRSRGQDRLLPLV